MKLTKEDLQAISDFFSNTRRLSILFFNEDEAKSLVNSTNGFNHLTLAKKHETVRNVSTPCLCLLQTQNIENEQCYLGTITDKSAITTFETRPTIKQLKKINLVRLSDLAERIESTQNKNRFINDTKEATDFLTLTHAPSRNVLYVLLDDEKNHEAFQSVLTFIPSYNRKKHVNHSIQQDADNFALKVFGIDANKKEKYGERYYEDNIIIDDLHNLEGFDKIQPTLTGKVSYQKGDERLTIYHANKLPLEEMLGVDLIYINEIHQSIVMFQYKMLEKTADNWVYRPDKQINDETSRMVIPTLSDVVHDDYRLHDNPFFFYFFQRSGNNLKTPMIISLDHYSQFITTPKAEGERGGIRIGYNELQGCYLRKNDIIGLVRSGYIGTHTLETRVLQPVINRVSKGDKALVLAYQKKIKEYEFKN